MCADRIDIADALSKLSPKERVEAEDLLLEMVVRQADARRPKLPPEAEKLIREQVEAVVAAIGPLTPEGAAAVRVAWREMARAILAEESGDAGPS